MTTLAGQTPKRGKWVAASVALLGAATLAGGAYASRDAAVEWWWIWKLRSAKSGERNAAAEKLVSLKSLRAVPHLVEAVRRDPTEKVHRFWIRVDPSGRMVKILREILDRSNSPFSPLAQHPVVQ